ncbi:MAG: LysR family transcriptional regulator [Thermoleophilia bacterium]
MLLNLNQLRIFHLAAREGSFARAAELLFITPPAVTRAIKTLESYYGVNLFRKAGRGVALTSEGELLYQHARPIFVAADNFEQVLRELITVGPYELRVGASKMFARYLMSTITAFGERYPNVTVILKDTTSEEAVKGVETGTNHLAIVGRLDYPVNLRVKNLRRADFAMATGPSNSLVGKDDVSGRALEGQPVIFREPGSSAGRALRKRLAELAVKPLVAVETGSMEFMKQYAAERGVLAFFFPEDIQADLASGRLIEVPLREGPMTLEIDIVFQPDAYRSAAVQVFIDMLEKTANDDWNRLPEAAPPTAVAAAPGRERAAASRPPHQARRARS